MVHQVESKGMWEELKKWVGSNKEVVIIVFCCVVVVILLVLTVLMVKQKYRSYKMEQKINQINEFLGEKQSHSSSINQNPKKQIDKYNQILAERSDRVQSPSKRNDDDEEEKQLDQAENKVDDSIPIIREVKTFNKKKNLTIKIPNVKFESK